MSLAPKERKNLLGKVKVDEGLKLKPCPVCRAINPTLILKALTTFERVMQAVNSNV